MGQNQNQYSRGTDTPDLSAGTSVFGRRLCTSRAPYLSHAMDRADRSSRVNGRHLADRGAVAGRPTLGLCGLLAYCWRVYLVAPGTYAAIEKTSDAQCRISCVQFSGLRERVIVSSLAPAPGMGCRAYVFDPAPVDNRQGSISEPIDTVGARISAPRRFHSQPDTIRLAMSIESDALNALM